MSILLIAQREEEIIPTPATQIGILLALDSPTASDYTFSSSVLFSIYFSHQPVAQNYYVIEERSLYTSYNRLSWRDKAGRCFYNCFV